MSKSIDNHRPASGDREDFWNDASVASVLVGSDIDRHRDRVGDEDFWDNTAQANAAFYRDFTQTQVDLLQLLGSMENRGDAYEREQFRRRTSTFQQGLIEGCTSLPEWKSLSPRQ